MATGSSTAHLVRPGMFSTHRGRRALIAGIALVVAMFAFSLISGMVRDDSGSANAAPADPTADADLADAEVEQLQAQEPDIAVNPANPFNAQGAADVSAEFEGSENYDSMMRAAEDAAMGLGTYSAAMTPKEYVEQVPGLDEKTKAELLKQAKGSWSGVKDSGLSVTASVSGVEPIVRRFSEDAHMASVEVVVDQRAMEGGAEKEQRAAGYVVHLHGIPVSEEERDAATTSAEDPVAMDSTEEVPLEWIVIGVSAM